MVRTRRRHRRGTARQRRGRGGNSRPGTAARKAPSSEWEEFHRQQIAMLADRGFRVAPGLPAGRDERELRPREEIARRLVAIRALMAWTCAPPEQIPSDAIRETVDRCDLGAVLDDAEKEILQTPRTEAGESFHDRIGWKCENAWPLAWILGHPEPPALDGAMIDGPAIRRVLVEFAPDFDDDLDAWVSAREGRTGEDVLRLEHTFYCLHNAVRRAQLGGDTVPEGFDPVANGGVVHERRLALTWALSPGVAWDETDVSA